MSGSRKVTRPVSVSMPSGGILFVESEHDRSFRMDARRDAFRKIVCVIRGKVVFETPGKPSMEGGEGSFFAVQEGLSHRILDVTPSTLLLLCLDPGYVGECPERAALWNRIVEQNGRNVRMESFSLNGQFGRLWRHALLEQMTSHIGNSLQVRACADQILVLLGRLPKKGGGGSAPERVATVIRELERTFYDRWNIDRACERAGMSRHHFSSLFRKATGMSFVEKVGKLRLDHALRLLSQGHSITGAAFACGSEDLSHFYRIFKKRFGMPPGEWVKRHPGTKSVQVTGGQASECS